MVSGIFLCTTAPETLQPTTCAPIVPTGEFPDKVFCIKCTEEEFVIGQVVRWCCVYLLVSLLLQPLLFSVSEVPDELPTLEFWEKKINE